LVAFHPENHRIRPVNARRFCHTL